MADFEKILVKDNRLDVTDKIKYMVAKGGQNVTPAQFKAISKSNNQLTFNIQVPSEQTIIDRRILLKTRLQLRVTTNNNGATGNNVGCRYGANAALAPFPLHQLMNVASATINNNTVSINVQDVLPSVMRLLDKDELACYNGTTPTYQDTFYNYADGLNNINNSLASYFNSANSNYQGRGSVAPVSYVAQTGTNQQIETFEFELAEPLLLSPFIFANPKSNSQGFYGVQNMNFVFNLEGSNPTRVFRGLDASNGTVRSFTVNSPAQGANTPSIANVELLSIGEPELLFTFLTPHPSQLMPARNIVPYYELPRYITQTGSVSAATVDISFGNSIIRPASATFNSQSLQLNQIPDKLIILVRKPLSNQRFGDADSALVIDGISINFNNQSGILSASTPQDLYRMTKDNCSNTNWYEFSGLATEPENSSATAIASGANFRVVPTIGTFLVLEFGKDIQLVEDFYSAGSLGNFNLQVRVNVKNQNNYSMTNTELVIITMNSGCFVNERGTSATYTGILTKADVLEASEQEAYTRSDVQRLVGGGFLDSVKSAVQKMAPIAKAIAPIAKELLGQSDNRYAKMGSKALGAMGYGMSAGGMSAGGMSAGRMANRLQ